MVDKVPWTDVQVEKLLKLRADGLTFTTIGKALGRSKNSCISRHARCFRTEEVLEDIRDRARAAYQPRVRPHTTPSLGKVEKVFQEALVEVGYTQEDLVGIGRDRRRQLARWEVVAKLMRINASYLQISYVFGGMCESNVCKLRRQVYAQGDKYGFGVRS